MAHTELAVNRISPAGILDPAGVTGLVGGHKFQNDGFVYLRVVNAGSNTSAVVTLSPKGTTVSGGSYALRIEINKVVYVTAAILNSAAKAAIATAVLAAVNPVTGNALSADFPNATCVGGGTDLPTGDVTLTFGGGTPAAGGLGSVAIYVSVDQGSLSGGGQYFAYMSTVGKGTAFLLVENANGPTQPGLTLKAPVGTYDFGPFLPSLYTQTTSGADPGETYLDTDYQFANLTITAYHLGA